MNKRITKKVQIVVRYRQNLNLKGEIYQRGENVSTCMMDRVLKACLVRVTLQEMWLHKSYLNHYR
jgi:hypothetical protein